MNVVELCDVEMLCQVSGLSVCELGLRSLSDLSLEELEGLKHELLTDGMHMSMREGDWDAVEERWQQAALVQNCIEQRKGE